MLTQRGRAVARLVAVIVVVVLAGAAGILTVYVTHPRDEAAYLAYMPQMWDPQGHEIALPPAAELVAEGDRSCRWLNKQPPALWRTGLDRQGTAVALRYEEASIDIPMAWDGEPTRYEIALNAFGSLCPATRWLRAPHNPFRPQQD